MRVGLQNRFIPAARQLERRTRTHLFTVEQKCHQPLLR